MGLCPVVTLVTDVCLMAIKPVKVALVFILHTIRYWLPNLQISNIKRCIS